MAIADRKTFGTILSVSDRITDDDREGLASLLRDRELYSVFELNNNRFDPELTDDRLRIVRHIGTIARDELIINPDDGLFRILLLRGVPEKRLGAKNTPFSRGIPDATEAPEQSIYFPLSGRFLVGETPASITRETPEIKPDQLVVVSPGPHTLEIPPEALVLGLCFRDFSISSAENI